MAWTATGRTNAELVANLFTTNLITSPVVKSAFLQVDRAHFAASNPYQDSPQYIGYGATISAPHMHAVAAEQLLPYLRPSAGQADGSPQRQHQRRRTRVLDVGSGSGYLTAVLSVLSGPRGLVVGVEHVQGLVQLGRDNVAKSEVGREMLDAGRVKFVLGDGRKGWKEEDHVDDGKEAQDGEQGWDAIHVGAAADGWPQALVDQLRAPGRMFIPVSDPDRDGNQDVWVLDKDNDGKVERKKLFGVRYVPLTDAEAQLRGS